MSCLAGCKRIWLEMIKRRLPLLVVASLICLVLFQAFAYYDRLTLSLGPRVIMQPWLIQNGFVMYENIADLHSPLMPLILAWSRPLVTDGLLLAKLVLVFLIALSTILIFLAAQRLTGWLGGLWAAWFFFLLLPSFGFGKLWYETFLAPLYVLLLLNFKPSSSRRSFKSLLFLGFIGGIALLIKQHSVVVVVSLLVWTALSNYFLSRSLSENIRELALICLGIILPVVAFIAYQYIRASTLKGFFYWTISYSMTTEYKSLAAKWATINQIQVVVMSIPLVIVAFFYLIGLNRRRDITWLYFGWGFILLAASGLTIYPRFEYFHLQATIPVVVWLSVLALGHAWRTHGISRPFVLGMALGLSIFWLIRGGAAYLPVFNTFHNPQRIAEYSHLEPLAIDLSQYIGPSDSIYVFPDDEATANLYYLMRHLPPGFWIFSYPWNMSDSIKSRVLSTLRKESPEWIVYLPGRWKINHYAPEIVTFIQAHYRKAAKLNWAGGRILLLRHLE